MRPPAALPAALLILAGCTERGGPPAIAPTPAPVTASSAAPPVVPAVREALGEASAPPDGAPASPPRPQAPGTFALPPPPAPRAAPGVGGPDFSVVFAQVSPSVVGVAAGRMRQGRFSAQRTGTGFVWDAAGHILTNDHLVADADVVRVRVQSGKVLSGRVLAGDGPMDLALVVTDEPVPPPVPRGREAPLRPGEWVAAIGNPFGLQHSITVGVISATGRRRLPGGGPRFGSFIQTDTPVNPGNSGGPLVDAHGQVIGLNTVMLGDAQGLAFAIPIDQADVVVSRLLADGRFVRGFGGLVVKPVTDRLAREAGLAGRSGARVSKIVAGGPADTAGLRPGDILLSFGDEPVANANGLPWLIASTAPGTAVPLKVARGRTRLALTLTVQAAP